MDIDRQPDGRPDGLLTTPTWPSSSFAQFLASYAPDLLPGRRGLTATEPSVPGGSSAGGSGRLGDEVPHGTTIIAATYEDGVVMAGDRRATQGPYIAVRDVEKVFPADEHTLIGFAGSAGLGVELIRLYQVELEHYEKIEGAALSVDGKANRLSMLVRGNLAMVMQGLAVVPVLAAYDLEAGKGRIFSYDVSGGRYEERNFYSVGSGSMFARGAMKKLHDPRADRDACAAVCLQALYDAADDDSATGGPDVTRKIYPIVATVTEAGYRRLGEQEVASLVERMLAERMRRPDGPTAPVFGSEGSASHEATGEGSDAR